MSIRDLSQTYDEISDSYHSKKSQVWRELLDFIPSLSQKKSGILLDAGSGNGRNLKHLERTLVIAMDTSEQLLRGFIGYELSQRVVGDITHIPIRSFSINEECVIAVIHHLPDNSLRILSVQELHRVSIPNGKTILSVWRKWRKELREFIIKNVKEKRSIEGLVNENRPWKSSSGNILGYRFYHYYTWKELHQQIDQVGFILLNRWIMGGKYGDANFLVILKK